ncbi:hypothetical protein [Streptomyces griseoluteus]
MLLGQPNLADFPALGLSPAVLADDRARRGRDRRHPGAARTS